MNIKQKPMTASAKDALRRRRAKKEGKATASMGRASSPMDGLSTVRATSQPVTVVPRLAPSKMKYASDKRRRPTCVKLTLITEVTLLDWMRPSGPDPRNTPDWDCGSPRPPRAGAGLPVRRWMASLMTTMP